jgi:hypothetical protein
LQAAQEMLDRAMGARICPPQRLAGCWLRGARRQALDEGPRRVLDTLVTATIEHEFAAPIGRLSAREGDEGRELRGGDALPAGGYGALATHLARGLDIRTGMTVARVELDPPDGGAAAVTGRDGTRLEADAVIVTVPLGVLQAGAIEFRPELPAPHRSAIARLGMGLLDKVVLELDDAVWPTATVLGLVPAQGQRFVEWVPLDREDGAPALIMGFNAADVARSSTDDDAVVPRRQRQPNWPAEAVRGRSSPRVGRRR